MKAVGRPWTIGAWVLVAGFLATSLTYYEPAYGFTRLIGFDAGWHDRELPAVRSTPHPHDPAGGYDGKFYVQLAVDPLLRDESLGRALGNPSFRARRILFSWTAFVIGLGRPPWILQVYAVQNIAAWLAIAWLLCRWIRPVDLRSFVLWAGLLLSHGMLVSVRYALPDLPAALLVTLAAVAAESGKPFFASLAIGCAALGRETALCASGIFLGLLGRTRRSWWEAGSAAALGAVPLALWIAYVALTHDWRLLPGVGNIGIPFVGLAWKIRDTADLVRNSGLTVQAIGTVLAIAAFVAQATWVGWILLKGNRSTWALLSLGFLLLGISAQEAVWGGSPGAFTRLTLPLAIGANVLMAQHSRRPLWAVLLLNLGVVPGVLTFALRLLQ